MIKPDLLTELPPGAADFILRNDFSSFVRTSFAVINPGTQLVWDPYLDLICSRLKAVVDGETRRLIITLPPRHLKSICVSVALPAFYLGHNPAAQVMCVSYNQQLSKGFSEDTQAIMTSPFYTGIFDTRLAPGRQSSSVMRTTKRGARRATSMQGTATGLGADLLIFDDPQKASEILSEKVRGDTNELFRSTFLSRANNPAKSRTVIVMQRLHEDDFVGFVSGLGPKWEILNLPAIAEEDEAYTFKTILGSHLYKRAQGAALHPSRLPLGELAELREQVGEAVWATQYMQRPAPAGGHVVNTNWFKRYAETERPEAFDEVLQSWDIASALGEKRDYTVCTTWGAKGKQRYLLDVFRNRMIFPELKAAVIAQDAIHKPSTIVIEDHGSGTALIQDLQRDGFPKVRPYKPVGDKRTRMEGQTGPMAAGYVFLPQEAHWLPDYLHELAVFPNGRHDDQVDSTSQALDALHHSGDKYFGWLELARQAAAAKHRPGGNNPAKPEWSPGSMEWAAEQAEIKAARERGELAA